MGQATPAQMQVAQNLAQQAARMQSMAAAGGVPPGAGGPHGMMLHGGGFPGMAGLRPPPGGVPFGLPGGVGGPPNGVLPLGASPQGMRPSGVPMAPAQMMAGGMPPPQVRLFPWHLPGEDWGVWLQSMQGFCLLPCFLE